MILVGFIKKPSQRVRTSVALLVIENENVADSDIIHHEEFQISFRCIQCKS